VLLVVAGWTLLSSDTRDPPANRAETTARVVDADRGAPTTNEYPGAVSSQAPMRDADSSDSLPALPTAKDEAVTAKKTNARLALAVTPWGEVYVNGQRKGISPPMKELKLAPGKYMIEIRNTSFPPYRESIDLRIASQAKIHHEFR